MWDLSSLTRDWTWVPCIPRRIRNHWTTTEVPVKNIFEKVGKFGTEEIKQLIKDITELSKTIDDKDKYIDFLIGKIKNISNNSISTEIARNIAKELMSTLGLEKSIINLWYEKKIANFCVSVLNNIIIKRNRIVYPGTMW